MENISLTKIEIKNSILIILISFHIFFWDIKLFNNFGLREFIVIGLFFYISELFKNNPILSLNRKILYFKIFLILSLVFFHLILNIARDDLKFDIISIFGLFGTFYLFFFIENYYDFIRKNLNKIIIFFLICLIVSVFFSGITTTTDWEKNNLGHCIFLFKFSNSIFYENSHLAMILPAAIGYLFINSDQIKYKYFYSIILCIFFVFQNSLTFTISILILLSLIFIFEIRQIKYLIPGILIFILLVLSKNIYEKKSNSCFEKFNTTFKAVIDVSLKENILSSEIKKNESLEKETTFEKETTLEKDKAIELDEIQDKRKKYFSKGKIIYKLPDVKYKFYLGDGKEIVKNEKNMFIDYIPKNKAKVFHDLPREIYEERFNLSTAVLINSINISIQTLKERVFGWGLNRYERAFDYYMLNTIVIAPFYHEIFTLNYNDGSSNFTKSITEFGILSFIFIPLIFFFCFTDKVNRCEKIFFLTIIFTQLLRGAGYFNGGFAFSLIFIILTYLKKNEN